uniref:hypothetical protein n=1 Tax=Paractinoplanes polyasparticus TaxID=2856853 RepID=UPI001C85611E|nr:hypothetical protein [Actinoplanes polyasparticus]
MRIGRRRLSAAIAGFLLVIVVLLGAITLVRWRAAGTAHEILRPAQASTQLPEGEYETVVDNRANIIALALRNDRGPATVHTYALPPNSPWLQTQKRVATQLDHWPQTGDCTDNPDARILECTWREPTRWWPREVRLTMMRPPPPGEPRSGWPNLTIVIIGSAPGA